ncbi:MULTISPECIES: hypothetical protein [Actinosynnema]|uniref:hypothetical protein n=1 Tax=Actinosynnema TaxID=40566 RepID=UPI0020A28CC9|nr:hypothetical protein [Actinosynnema pretiosum]MCP2093347.1 hypothetical protein [Actinosynnema pretiosum]
MSWKNNARLTHQHDQAEGARQAAKQAKATANENDVLKAASELDPKDKSERAQYLREVAEDIQDHRTNPGRFH